jgi:hypothetical protein
MHAPKHNPLACLCCEPQVEAAVTCADLMGRLLALRTALPAANISAMVARSPAVLQLLPEQLETAVQQAGGLAARQPVICCTAAVAWMSCSHMCCSALHTHGAMQMLWCTVSHAVVYRVTCCGVPCHML